MLVCGAAVYGEEPLKEARAASISLNDIPMGEAARLITIATGVPIVVSRNAAAVKVDLYLQNADGEAVLEAICRANKLWYKKDPRTGMVYIQTLAEFKESLNFAGEDTVRVIQILYPSARDVGDALAKLFINRVIWTAPNRNSGDGYNDLNRALRRMDLLGERGTFDITGNSIDSIDIDDEDDDDSDMRDTQRRREALEAVTPDLSKLNTEELSGMLGSGQGGGELKYHELTSNPGVVFIAVMPESNSLLLRSADANAIAQMEEVIAQLDRPSPQVLLEVKILSVKLDNTKDRAIDFLFASNDDKFSGGFANGTLSGGGGQNILEPNENMVPQGSGLDPKSAVFTAISDNFRVRVQMLERDQRVTRLATPNLIVGNNESTTLFIGDEVTVMERAQQTVTYTELQSGFQPSISWEIDAPRRRIGTSLLIAPKIHADRTVTIRLLQEHSLLGDERKSAFSGGTGVVGAEEQYFISQDINMQRLVTTVVGQDQQFMVIGGLVEEGIEKTTEKVPWLGDIPVIGELVFTRLNADRVRREVLIIIRPFVMLAPGEGQAVSQDYLKRISQHPAAREDLPSLGVNAPRELAKPQSVNPNDPWLVRMMDQLGTGGVDTTSQFDVYQKMARDERRENHRKALREIEALANEKEL